MLTVLSVYYFGFLKKSPDDLRYAKFGGKPQVMLKVPFIPQVAHNNDELSRLGCEEASLLMTEKYKKGLSLLENTEAEMTDLIKKEHRLFGGHVQVGSKRLGQLANQAYEINFRVENLRDINQLKGQLQKGQPVILPVKAGGLNNPFYSEKGYHMIVLIGFNNYGFWAHDPGTSTGGYYFYSNERIINSAWDVDTKSKTFLILED